MNRSAEPADLLLGHNAFDVLGLALDAVTRTSIGLDRQAGHDGINAALLDAGATLRPLKLMMNVVVDREIVSHRLCPFFNRAFSRNYLITQQFSLIGRCQGKWRKRLLPGRNKAR